MTRLSILFGFAIISAYIYFQPEIINLSTEKMKDLSGKMPDINVNWPEILQPKVLGEKITELKEAGESGLQNATDAKNILNSLGQLTEVFSPLKEESLKLTMPKKLELPAATLGQEKEAAVTIEEIIVTDTRRLKPGWELTLSLEPLKNAKGEIPAGLFSFELKPEEINLDDAPAPDGVITVTGGEKLMVKAEAGLGGTFRFRPRLILNLSPELYKGVFQGNLISELK